MARPLRIEFDGAVYHITSRGNSRDDIFLNDEDRKIFLDVVALVVDRFKWKCHAYCLMSNHYHLMIETPQANLSRGMRQLNGVYTQRFNRSHGHVGHLFQGRFKSIVVDKESYLLELSRYIVRNPVAANMVGEAADWPWSSYNATAGQASSPAWLETQWLLSQFSSTKKQAERAYINFVARNDLPSPWNQLNGPDILGDDDFRCELQANVDVESNEVPKKKRVLRHLPLSEIERGKEQQEWMYEAYTEHGYTMQDIATYAGLHHSTISKKIKRARIKT